MQMHKLSLDGHPATGRELTRRDSSQDEQEHVGRCSEQKVTQGAAQDAHQ